MTKPEFPVPRHTVVAPARGTVNEKIAAAVPAYVTERDSFKSFPFARGHCPSTLTQVANKSGAPLAALGMVGSGSINVGSSSLARELFTRLDTSHLSGTSFPAGL